MGRAARWFRGLFGGRSAGAGGAAVAGLPDKEKRRWGFVKSFREREKGQKQQQQQQRGEPPASAAAVTGERKGSYRESSWPYDTSDLAMLEAVHGVEQNQHAIAMAAATAAVAEAALAAAQAAAAVVRLTSSGRCVSGSGAPRREERAAVKIQAAFRGYLARRALRALKGLVKLQALVRGNIVRKQAAGTLRCMHALVRVQARARECRTLRPDKGSRPDPGPPTSEKYEEVIRANAAESDEHCSLKRNSSNPISFDSVDSDRRSSSGWNWLDRWMEERYWDSRVAFAAAAAARVGSCEAMDDEKNAKILEIDNGKPLFQPKRRSNHLRSPCSTVTLDQNNCCFATVRGSPSKDSTTAHQSIPSASSVDTQQSPTPLGFPVVESGEFGESPQFCSAASRPGSSRRDPFTPYQSECARSLFSGYADYPNYMASTESSWAKVRSQSAPKQRPDFEKSGSLKGLSGHGIGHQQPPVVASSQRSSALHSKFTNKAYPGSGRLDRLGMPIRI